MSYADAAMMAALGRYVLTTREVLGLSQDELARVAGISQSAVSRIEGGRCLALTLLTALRALGGLAAATLPADGAVAPSLRTLAVFAQELSCPDGPAPAPDPGLATLLRTYHAMTPGRRATFLRLVLPLAAFVAETSLREHAA